VSEWWANGPLGLEQGCVVQTPSNKHKPACERTVTADTLSLSAPAGDDKINFQGLISRSRKLAPGGYTVTISATSAKGSSAPRSLKFTIVP
jgi:hypothetical protein